MKIAAMLLFVCVLQSDCFPQLVFPVKTSTNKRYLVDQRNRPFPIQGRTSWCIISQPAEGYRNYIDNTLLHGFNSIEMSVICHWPSSNHPPHNGQGDIPFEKQLNGSPWKGGLVYKDTLAEAPDMNTPDERYWKYVDEFFNYCETKGILIFLFPGYVGYDGGDQGWMQELIANGPQKVRRYGAWIAERYKNQKNLVWMLLGDQGKFTPIQKEAEAALIAGLKSVSGQQSVHYSAESFSGQSSVDQVDFGHEMNLNGAYTWDSVGVPAHGRKAYQHTPVTPAFLLEEPYDEEGPDGNNYNPHATQPVRRFQWWGWLTTTGGYMAGNGFIWPFIDPYWKQHLNTNAVKDMGVLNKFIRSVEWWKLVPSGLDGMKNLITKGEGKDTSNSFVAASATMDGTLLVAYVPPAHVGSITVDLTALRGKIHASWLDPTDGTMKNIFGSPFSDKGDREFVIPGKNSGGENDWVLLLTTDFKHD
jgi:hypothetical protein